MIGVSVNIYLFDHTYDQAHPERCLWYEALCNRLSSFGPESVVVEGTDPPSDHAAYQQNAILFVHSDGKEESWRRRADVVAMSCHIVLVRSAGRHKVEQNSKGNLHGCHWSPDEFARTPARHEIEQFAQQVNGGFDEVNWTLLRPPPRERVLTLRLLCEGWLLKNWSLNTGYERIQHLRHALGVDTKDPDLHGIILTVPHSQGTWLSPFLHTGDDPVEGILGEIMAEETKAMVKSFLEMVSDSQPDFTRVADVFLAMDMIANELA